MNNTRAPVTRRYLHEAAEAGCALSVAAGKLTARQKRQYVQRIQIISHPVHPQLGGHVTFDGEDCLTQSKSGEQLLHACAEAVSNIRSKL